MSSFFDTTSHTIRQKGYNPPSTFVTNVPDAGPSTMVLEQVNNFSTQFLASKADIPPTDLQITNSYCDSKVCHVYFYHQINGIPVINHPASVHTTKDKIITYSFNLTKHKVKTCDGGISIQDATSRVEKELGMTARDKRKQIYYDTGNEIVAAWEFELEGHGDLVNAAVDKCSGEVVHIHSYMDN